MASSKDEAELFDLFDHWNASNNVSLDPLISDWNVYPPNDHLFQAQLTPSSQVELAKVESFRGHPVWVAE